MLIDFSKFSSIKIGGVFEVAEISYENASEFNGVIIGACNNILISPKPPNLGILSDDFKFIELLDDEILRVGAKTKSSQIYNFAKKQNLAGFEFLRGIPGTLGGLLTMNAGLKGFEISNSLVSATTSKGKFIRDELDFSYRKSEIPGVIFEAEFSVKSGFDSSLSDEISKARNNQPKGYSFGSCFKNPANDSAGRLIESVQLKGYKIGGCKFSEIHANFLINFDNGKFEDATKLINLAKKRVLEEHGVKLECEVKIV
ncbi:UDP-N-acetylmuramate dehydrogenase [Campylobacter corcagiensis]|uniref:UDP-N-acetylenolpyruvoylglucosamine reductase n=1 Tax=Campylobacter corcagiensis TaxID=1448857 RepID=A0A7M1LJM8_9BACT|nr:UDP-N-acetylmuramate dehydrogenase [Campylobacter corcagiensis]QKF65408.1 UDP-N-acetylenolpyruvoylglucosamine reductase [Campylobacter corcagiensis]QOQ88016.1 UDP-N-acetylmuramate dehydrogenase [Campylobacter corcagiensis]